MSHLFEVDGNHAMPTELTRGPWTADAQHGGPPSALLMFLAETAVEPGSFIARMHVELLAPVPLDRLTTSVQSEQLSRRVGIVTTGLAVAGSIVARATARVLAESDAPEPPMQPESRRALTGPETEKQAPAWFVGATHTTFHRDALRHRWESGDFDRPGPARCWQNLTVQVVAGTEPSGHQRVMALADIASGVSAAYAESSGYGLINSDLDVAFVRPPQGVWIGTDAISRVGVAGTGLCSNTLSDESGVVAVGTQTLLGRRM